MGILKKILLSTLLIILIYPTAGFCNSFVHTTFLERLEISKNFESYTLKTANGLELKFESSLLNASELERNLSPKLYEQQNISVSNLTDETINYLSIELNALQFVQLAKSNMVFDSVYVKCTVQLTDRYGNLLNEKSRLDYSFSDLFDTAEKRKKKQDDFIAPPLVEALIGEIGNSMYHFISEAKVKPFETIPLLQVNLSSTINEACEESQDIWDLSHRKHLLKLTNGTQTFTGTIIHAAGYFICDYKALAQDSIITATNYFDETVQVTVVAVDKNWELALCKLPYSIDCAPNLEINAHRIGQKLYYSGYTTLERLPIISGETQLEGLFIEENLTTYLMRTVNATSLSGAPLLNKAGLITGVLIASKYKQNNAQPVYLFYPNEALEKIFNVRLSI